MINEIMINERKNRKKQKRMERKKQIVKKVVRGRKATIYIVHFFFFVSPVLDVGPDGKVTYEKKESSK